jgi:hypothetical protein
MGPRLVADGDGLGPDAVGGALVVGPAAGLAEAGIALAAPWPALHAVARKAATTITAAVGDADHLNERIMFLLQVTEVCAVQSIDAGGHHEVW